MKATLRQNGLMMMTVKMELHIGLFEIASAIMEIMNAEKTLKPKLTRKKVIERVKMIVASNGETRLEYMIEHIWIEDASSDEITKTSNELALKLFPELA